MSLTKQNEAILHRKSYISYRTAWPLMTRVTFEGYFSYCGAMFRQNGSIVSQCKNVAKLI